MSIAPSEEDALLTLIDTSIVVRYEGNLERVECCERDGWEVHYLPLDTDNIRELLTALWGEHITTETLDAAFDRLTRDGAEGWPRAWCEKDIREEKNARLCILDHDIECTEAHLADLRQEAKELLADLKQES